MLSFLRICSSVKHARLCTHRHITVFIILHPHTTFNQDLFSAKSCLMSFVQPSHAFKLQLVLDSTDLPWLGSIRMFILINMFCCGNFFPNKAWWTAKFLGVCSSMKYTTVQPNCRASVKHRLRFRKAFKTVLGCFIGGPAIHFIFQI